MNGPLHISSNRPAGAINGRRAPAATTARAALGALAVLLALLLAACDLDTEKETVLIKYDPAADVAQVRLIYEGIQGGAATNGLAELERVARSGTIFYLPSSVLGWTEVDTGRPPDSERASLLDRAFRGRAAVTQGRFFLNGEGKLLAWQDLRLSDVRRIASVFNAAGGTAGGSSRPQDLDSSLWEFVESVLPPLILPLDQWQWLLSANVIWIGLDTDGLHAIRSVPPEGDVVPLAAPTVLGFQLVGFMSDVPMPTAQIDRIAVYRAAPDPNGVIKVEFRSMVRHEPDTQTFLVPGEPLPKLPRPLDSEVTIELLIEEFAAPALGGDDDPPSAPIPCFEEKPDGIPSCA